MGEEQLLDAKALLLVLRPYILIWIGLQHIMPPSTPIAPLTPQIRCNQTGCIYPSELIVYCGIASRMKTVGQSEQALTQLKDRILSEAPSKRIEDLFNYLEQYHLPPSCTSAITRCFSRRKHKTISSQLRIAYEGLEYGERSQFYAKVLHGCKNILSKQTPLPTSVTHMNPPFPRDTVDALVKDHTSADQRKEVVEIDYETLRIERGASSLALQDYMLTSKQDHFIRKVALLPLAPKLPELQLHCHPQLFQRLEEASAKGTIAWLMGMMEGTKGGSLGSQNEEEAQSERTSIVKKLPERVMATGEEQSYCNAQEKDYLTCRHPQEARREDCRRLLPQGKTHYFFEGEYKLGKEGELVVSNQAKLEAQSSVIKYILKRLLSGGKVTNISLPVTVFGTESNLSLLMGSFRHAPLILSGARHLGALDRFKQVVKFALSCPPCYIRCDKPFNPILGETYQRRVAGTLFYGEQISHHPPVSATLILAPDFTLYGCFEAEVEFGFNSAVGNNRGWTKISFHPRDTHQQVVKFTNSPGEMGGLIFGKRTLKLTGSVYFIDEEHLLFCELFFGRVKLQPGVTAKQDSIEGRVVRLKPGTDLDRPEAISERDVEESMGLLRGQWLSRVYFNDELLLDSLEEHPPVIDDYQGLLPSDYSLRQDLQLKLTGDIQKCQAAKEALEEAQRRDRKLREDRKG